MKRRLVGIALRNPSGRWVVVGGGSDRRKVYPTRGAAIAEIRALGGQWRLIAIYTRRKAKAAP